MKFIRKQVLKYWFGADEKALCKALADLSNDFDKVLSSPLIRTDSACQADLVFVNLQKTDWPGLNIKAGHWERYQIAVINQQVIIAGADTRGLLFGMYQFSQHALGVDPLYFWIPEAPQPRETVDPSSAVTVGPEPTFKYRGWYISGHDLLDNWSYGTARKTTGWRSSGRLEPRMSIETYEKILEAMLRLRVNLIIPADSVDVMEPKAAKVLDCTRDRGLMFSFHHVEPLGVCPIAGFKRYCRQRSLEPRFSWYSNRQVVEDCWRHYIDRLADYGDSIVWQLGYRGGKDCPFWQDEPDAPKDMPSRGKIIGEAISRQYELLLERLGRNADPVCTWMLWHEGDALYRQGWVELPEPVMAVVSDVGRTQMLPETIPTIEPERKYGTYYHVSFWSTGPQLIQANPFENIFANCRRAIDAGATEYFMVLVSNLRPFLPAIQATSDMTFDAESFDDERFTDDYCQKHFGNHQVAGLYKDYFKAFVHFEDECLKRKNARWLDGALRMLARVLDRWEEHTQFTANEYKQYMGNYARALHMFNEAITSKEPEHVRDPKNWMCPDWLSLYNYARPQLIASRKRWKELLAEVEKVRPRLTHGKALYDANLCWASLIGESLTDVVIRIFDAVQATRDKQPARAAELLSGSADLLQSLLDRGPELAEQHYFKGWTSGDRYMGLSGLGDQLRRVAESCAV